MANNLLITFGVWLIQFFEIGIMKSFSVLLAHIVRDIHITTGQFGMYIGMYHSLSIMCGIIVKVFLDRYSPRSLAMIGGLISSLGLMVCSTVTKDLLFATCLFFSGLGSSFVIFPTLVSVINAFGDKYLLPFSVGAMGAGVGMMTLPLLTQRLLEAYNWRGALLILGAMNLHVVVFGAFFEPTILPRESPGSQCSPREIPQTRDDSGAIASSPIHLNNEENCDRVQPHASRSDLLSPLLCCHSALKFFWAAFQRSGVDVFRQYPMLIYFLIAAYLHGITYVGWTVFVIANAEAKGFDERIAVFLSLLGGIGNTIGRLMPGLLNFLNKDVFSSRISLLLFGMIGALPYCLNKVASRFSTLCMFAVLNGLALGAKTVLKNTSVVDVVPPSLSSTVLPFAMIASGLGEITGGWMTGRIYDITGSMDTAFIALGCIDIAGFVVLSLSLIHEKILSLKS